LNKYGLTSVTAQDAGTGLVERAAALGLDGAEPMMDDPRTSPLGIAEKRAAIIALAAEKGVRIPTAAFAHYNETGGFAKGAEGSAESLELAVDATREAGAKCLLVCSYFAGAPETADEVARFADGLYAALPYAEAADVRLALECPLDAATLTKIVDDAASDFLGVYYDVGNTVWLGRDPADEIRALGKRILCLHLKDTVETLGDRHLGEGKADWDRIGRALKEIRYDGWMMLETPPADDDILRKDIQFMKNLMDRRGEKDAEGTADV